MVDCGRKEQRRDKPLTDQPPPLHRRDTLMADYERHRTLEGVSLQSQTDILSTLEWVR
jgi:hypothetical protein